MGPVLDEKGNVAEFVLPSHPTRTEKRAFRKLNMSGRNDRNERSNNLSSHFGDVSLCSRPLSRSISPQLVVQDLAAPNTTNLDLESEIHNVTISP